jgi:glycosyltransferase involved in cell wall biosynthesis
MEASRATPASELQTSQGRPRVVMLMGSDPFGPDWSRAASRVAEVIELRTVRKLQWEPVGEHPFLARGPEGRSYEIVTLQWRPGRVFGQWNDRLMARRCCLALRHIALQHGHVDVVHAQFYAGARPLPYVKQQLGTHYVISEQSSALTGLSPEKSVSPQGLRSIVRSYANADCVMPVSEFLLQAIRRRELPGFFRVIPNPINIDKFPVATSYPPGALVKLVTVGRLAPVKGHDVLLRALAIARRSDSRLTLTIVGDGRRRGDLESLCKELGLRGAVRFVGQRSRSEVSRFLQESHVFVLASRVETFGVAVVEAALTGLPLVVTRVGAIPENVVGSKAILVPPDEPAQLAGGLLASVEELEFHSPHRQASMFKKRFSEEAVAEKLLDVYRGIMSSFTLGVTQQ